MSVYTGKSVYLAGAMTARRDRGKRWRKQLTPFLKRVGFTEVYDPTVEEMRYHEDFLKPYGCDGFHQLKAKNRDAYATLMRLVEGHDLELIGKSTHIVIYLDHAAFQSDGTIREFAEATALKKDILVVLTVPWIRVWGWTYRRCVEVDKQNRLFYTFADLKAYLRSEK